ncbi:hypothetical protein [Devosia aurantiaca]|uniref:Uncharacterized protein n=1 Tax=Devosia aurantiaca TaxID=2714858 RepID=A0A6M1SU62_9HYPH|nr:hypothetical protein [Devosia aurantiaca]NGP18892.1 hypothetical protein [Devosia aurantiaca]
MSDLDHMEARLRELWAVTIPRSALAAEDRAAAERLLGKTEAARLAATRRGDRFRYRPRAIQKIEYFWVPAGGQYTQQDEGWTIEATQNGVKSILGRVRNSERCSHIVRELKRRGYRVVLVVTEGMKAAGVTSGPEVSPRDKAARFAPGKTLPSKRKDILNRLRGFAHEQPSLDAAPYRKLSG